jgi:hypothetical protein
MREHGVKALSTRLKTSNSGRCGQSCGLRLDCGKSWRCYFNTCISSTLRSMVDDCHCTCRYYTLLNCSGLQNWFESAAGRHVYIVLLTPAFELNNQLLESLLQQCTWTDSSLSSRLRCVVSPEHLPLFLNKELKSLRFQNTLNRKCVGSGGQGRHGSQVMVISITASHMKEFCFSDNATRNVRRSTSTREAVHVRLNDGLQWTPLN